jgi:hypothetical protein
MALCFQQLLRGAECFSLTGANVTRHLDYFMVEVKEAKNNPEGFSFKVPIDPSEDPLRWQIPGRLHCQDGRCPWGSGFFLCLQGGQGQWHHEVDSIREGGQFQDEGRLQAAD